MENDAEVESSSDFQSQITLQLLVLALRALSYELRFSTSKSILVLSVSAVHRMYYQLKRRKEPSAFVPVDENRRHLINSCQEKKSNAKISLLIPADEKPDSNVLDTFAGTFQQQRLETTTFNQQNVLLE
ncbi:hypothetical protein LOAG_13968 [Loa loa]|uniref:Uncharacterized protein n=1 Tax=Loa loa TaxID=7209 RepID=A0A1S0TIK4_LOALO|nr:hypothetical protein LOAG_13968 [Loa loa]EFO14549.1 hypothetical protein LOAG_13968 [Loa loa]